MVQKIIIRCSDGLKNDKLTAEYPSDFIIAAPGGIKWFMEKDIMDQLFEQIEIGVQLKHATSVSIISHQPCGLYQKLGQDDYSRYTADLRHAKSLTSERFPDLSVELYLLDHNNNDQLIKVE